MNKSKLKNYAPKARREFIQAVTDRAHFYGLSKDKTEPIKVDGDFAIINGQAFPKAIADQREKLEERIASSTYEQVIEEIAYTWFNRFVAIRYMELHGYLSHGYRVLSNPDPDNSMPEILEKAQHVQLQGLNKEKVLELKMDGTKDEELYRMLLIAQCNELFRWMPFLFENIRDCTELLLPDNLLHSDSLIRKLVSEIDELDWKDVEIIGWMYQFYISEKKDQVIGKVVKSEDIPAATQLFTPNWIVKYLVQNSLGAQWLRTYPNSPLKEKIEYYIEPAEQAEEVQKQLAEITPDNLNPEELTLLDPACGSGHILVEAYDLFKEIYLERGYRRRDIPELILKKNLFGLEIDDRAAQLACFAVMMKARCDDRRIFEKGIQPNIVSIQETRELDVKDIVRAINEPLTSKDVSDAPRSMEELQDAIEVPLFFKSQTATTCSLDAEEKLTVDELKVLLGLFEHGKTFGSLIRIPEKLAEKLPAIAARVNTAYKSDNLSAFGAAQKVMPFINQALIMAGKYDAVVANPPYMGGGGMNTLLKKYAKDEFVDTKSDLFAMFFERGFELAKPVTGHNAMVTMQSWMFLSSFVNMRESLLNNKTIFSMAHLGPRAFSTISGEVVTVTAFSILNNHLSDYKPSFQRLIEGNEDEKLNALKNKENLYNNTIQSDFKKIPGSPIAYWVKESCIQSFQNEKLTRFVHPITGLQTGNKPQYFRFWHEVAITRICIKDLIHPKWYPVNTGGDFRKWFGNNEQVIDWEDNGKRIKASSGSVIRNEKYYLQEGITWNRRSSGTIGFRYVPSGYIYDQAGDAIIIEKNSSNFFIVFAFLNSKVLNYYCKFIAPINLTAGDVYNIPFILIRNVQIEDIINSCITLSKQNWDSRETSWNFLQLSLLSKRTKENSDLNSNCYSKDLADSYEKYHTLCRQMTEKIKQLEEKNNRIFIEAYGLENELTPDVPDERITLFANPKYRYGGNLSQEELEKRFREDTIKELFSYAVGCMMGRYSLDEPGLIYANSGNNGFEPKRYQKYSADDDGIIPITDQYWFDDDVAERFFRFIETVWPKETLEENLDFVAESIGRKSRETSRDAIRRYFVTVFFKDHLKTYKKRPIYWLFSSGKDKALQCLVYLHRYNEGTLSRMRTEYLIPLQGRIASKIDSLKKDMEHASSTSAANKIRKEIAKLAKQAEELRKYDEKLRHYADMKIKFDLDDGVKVNYGKFGDLLAEVKAVTGKKE